MSTQRAGPELPPHLLAKRRLQAESAITPGATTEAEFTSRANVNSTLISNPDSDSDSKRRRLVGPTPPPAPLDERPTGDPHDGNESSDEEDFGPRLPASGYSKFNTGENSENMQSNASMRPGGSSEKPSKRDDWMTMPPKQDDLAARMDPTKIRAKSFNTSKGSRGPAQGSGADNGMWTETPEEKRKRLENEVLGIVQPSSEPKDNQARQDRRDDEEKARLIREHNDKHRSKSLYDQHQGSKRKKEEDDPSKRAFDYEKDMAAGAKIGHSQRKELMNKAVGFSSKFSSGNYL